MWPEGAPAAQGGPQQEEPSLSDCSFLLCLCSPSRARGCISSCTFLREQPVLWRQQLLGESSSRDASRPENSTSVEVGPCDALFNLNSSNKPENISGWTFHFSSISAAGESPPRPAPGPSDVSSYFPARVCRQRASLLGEFKSALSRRPRPLLARTTMTPSWVHTHTRLCLHTHTHARCLKRTSP